MNRYPCHRMKKGALSNNTYGLLLGLAGLLWFLYRTGTKPSRIFYPCQRAALANSVTLITMSIPFSIIGIIATTSKLFSKKGLALLLLIMVSSMIVTSVPLVESDVASLAITPNQELRLFLEHRNATSFPASNIYVANGRAYAHISELIDLMGSNGLLFYESNATGANRGPSGLIARDDVVLIKINSQWPERGGTNTDVLKELVQAIIDHPDGFMGEIVVADNSQLYGSLDWPLNNAENRTQSVQDVVDAFASSFNISTYRWDNIMYKQVNEYSNEDVADGYIVYNNIDPETSIRVTYPKFQTKFGTKVSFKHGIWNGTAYEKRLKVINLPVLKTHWGYQVTGAVKHYMGVQAEGLGNGHDTVGTGGMGTLMVETGLPTLNIIDAIWVNANPYGTSMAGPATPYSYATRTNVLIASLDPIAIDYWAAKHVLVQTARMIGYSDPRTIDPDTSAFGRWLNLSRNEIAAAGYNVTNDENRMNVYISSQDVGVTGVQLSKTMVTQGGSVDVATVLRNYGAFAEQFNVTLYANATAVETKPISIPSQNTTVATFTWNTSGFDIGYYRITAYATPIPNETDLADNNKTAGNMVLVLNPEHDLVIRNIKVSKTIVGQGFVMTINVTALNVGNFREVFDLTVYANNTPIAPIATISIEIESGFSTTTTFTWNSTNFAYGSYTIRAYAAPPLNDQLTYGWVAVSIVADVYGLSRWPDGKVDIRDLAAIAKTYGAVYPDSRYNPNCDIIYDGKINIDDILNAVENYGKTVRR